VTLKEVRLSATIEDNDVAVRVKQAIQFLQDGDKVKVSIRFRGRQITHAEIGRKQMENFLELVKDHAVMERRPLLEGRHMIMILAPKETGKEDRNAVPRPVPPRPQAAPAPRPPITKP